MPGLQKLSVGTVADGRWDVALKCDADLISVVLGCEAPTLSFEQSMEILDITGRSVYNIYLKVIRHMEGIGGHWFKNVALSVSSYVLPPDFFLIFLIS